MKINSTYKKVKFILIILFAANIFTAILKIVVGFVINSSSVLADGFHSISDSASNIIGIIGITMASKPKDSCHPYGHKKFETISSISIGILLLLIGLNTIKSSLEKLFIPSTLNLTYESIIIMIITLILNIFIAIYENKQGKVLNSNLLLADSLHTKSDIFISIGVLIALITISLGLPPIIDILASFVVSFFILHASYEIIKENISILTDKNIINEELITSIIMEFKPIINVHNIRSRGYSDYIFLDMHIIVDPKLNVDEAHTIVHKIEDTLNNRLNKKVDLIIHVEPNTRS